VGQIFAQHEGYPWNIGLKQTPPLRQDICVTQGKQWDPVMRAIWQLLISLYLGLLVPLLAHAEEAEPRGPATRWSIDTEHIFGFAEGSDIGAKGELEIENITIGGFGALGSYSISTMKPRCVSA
jgi:hypothetical protein